MSTQAPGPSWRDDLRGKLPLFGHRNWIVVADAAYPAQTAQGIAIILADEDPLIVLEEVLSAIAAASHVKPNIYTDLELRFVAEHDAPGIDSYRRRIAELMRTFYVHALPHEEIIAKLDSVAQKFQVMIVKTRLTIPYTTIFLELDCAYWNSGAEARLRAAMSKPQAGGPDQESA